MQNEEQFAALFELIFKFGNCHHKIDITKMSALFFLTTVKRPSGIEVKPTPRGTDNFTDGGGTWGTTIDPIRRNLFFFCGTRLLHFLVNCTSRKGLFLVECTKKKSPHHSQAGPHFHLMPCNVAR